MKTFFITGLPRTRTAWFANLFTYKDSFCFHEAFKTHDTIDEYAKSIDKLPYKYSGNSDCSIPFIINDLMSIYPKSKIVVIERDIDEVYNSLIKLFAFDNTKLMNILLAGLRLIEELKQNHPCLVVQYNDINKRIKSIWEYCLPTVEFNQERYEMLKSLCIAINPKNYFDNLNPNNIIVQEVEKCLGW